MQITAKLTLRAACLWERLTGKSYYDLDSTNAEEVQTLSYAMYIAGGGERCTLETFITMLETQRLSDAIALAVKHEMEYLALLQEDKGRNTDSEADSAEADGSTPPHSEGAPEPRIGRVASMLIVELGLDPHYVMDRLEMWEIPDLLKAHEEKRHGEMEEKRLWTYYAIAPHIDTRKCASPQELIKFPWEKKREEETKARDLSMFAELIALTHGDA